MLIDTHCHLGDRAFENEVGPVVDRAQAAGVGHTVVIGESPEAAARAHALATADARLSATAGLHPHEASRWTTELGRWLEQALGDPAVVAAGEMGLDYHYEHSPRSAQREAFDAQLEIAARTGKPAVVHAREADDDVAAILRNHPRAKVIMHSYSSGAALLAAAVALGHYVSLSGMITFKSWTLDLRSIPIDRLLVETDAPYLAPVPYRGKRNEPAYVVETARRLAALIGQDPSELESAMSENAVTVFGPRVETRS